MEFLFNLTTSWIMSFILKGSALLLVAYGIIKFIKPKFAAERFYLLSSFFYLILLLPVLSLSLPKLHVPLEIQRTTAISSAERLKPVKQASSDQLKPSSEIKAVEDETFTSQFWRLSLGDQLLTVWGLVAALVYAKLLLGLLAVWFNGKRATVVHDRQINLMAIDLSNQLNLKRHVKLLVSKNAQTPMTWGIFQPFVLLPIDSAKWSEERLKYVLIHEFAHIKRRDFIQHIILQFICALFWFHPAVWILSKQLIADRETACDDAVLSEGAKATTYAEHLMDIAKGIKNGGHSSYASVCMARQNQLEGRLLSILEGAKAMGNRRYKKILSILVLTLFAVPLAAIQPVEKVYSEPVVNFPITHVELHEGVAEISESLSESIGEGISDHIAENVSENVHLATQLKSRNSIPPIRKFEDRSIEAARYGVTADFIREMKKQDFNKITLEDIIEFAKYGVTVEYVRQMRKFGFRMAEPSDIIDMAKYGVTTELVTEIKDAGYDIREPDELIDIAKYGVTPSYIHMIKKYYPNISLEGIAEMSKYGVTERLVLELKKADFNDLSASEIVECAKYGVDPKLIEVVKNEGFKNLTIDELVDMAKYGVSLKFVSDIRKLDLKNVTLDEIVEMAKYGVSINLANDLKASGYKNLNADELIDCAKYGVSSSLIRRLNEYNYKDVHVEDLVDCAKYGVSTGLLDALENYGYKNVSMEDLIDCAKYNVNERFITDLQKSGMKKVSLATLIKLRKYGIDPTYIKEMQNLDELDDE